MLSITKSDFFKNILKSPKPYIKRWPKQYPFDFEKKISDNIKQI